jgi:hypothetical protein
MKTLGLIMLLVGLLLSAGAAQAADLSVYVSCATPQDDGSFSVWFGYTASDTADESGFGYIDDGPGIYVDIVEVGQHDRIAEAMLSPGEDYILFFIDAWYGDEYVYSEAQFDWSTAAPSCEDAQPDEPAAATLDDLGAVNNPQVNDRANACYGAGQQCVSEADWEAGWYLIRKQYGLLN